MTQGADVSQRMPIVSDAGLSGRGHARRKTMTLSAWGRLPAWSAGIAGRVGKSDDDTDEVRLQKTLLLTLASMGGLAAVLWGLAYLVVREPLAASIPLAYAGLSLLSISIFAVTRRYHLFRVSQLLLTLLLPFLLMLVLGGFVSGSAVILWALLCPLWALLFASRRQAVAWSLAYVGLVVLSGILEAFTDRESSLSPALVTVFFVMNVSGVSVVAIVLLQYFVGQKNSALMLLNEEQEKSERLLLNVLPREIAAVLKDDDRTIADHFDVVSVLFADVVGFTSLSMELTPSKMVGLLNEVFSYFDSLAQKYGLEKIRTIGDNYMVASGVPRPRPDHAHALAHMALEMNAYISRGATTMDVPLQFRIGMNSGTAVAGVIGGTKFHYDLWGDAVNTASLVSRK